MRARWIVLGCVGALSGWSLPVAADPDGHVTLGTGWWDQTIAEAKYQEFREVPQGAFLESFLYRQRWGAGSAFALSGANAIRKDQVYTLMLARGVSATRLTGKPLLRRRTPLMLQPPTNLLTGPASFAPGRS